MADIRILIIDDHEIVRRGLKGFLELKPGFSVVGEGQNGHDAVRLAEELSPDVILMDLVMPGMDGISATRRIMDSRPESRILILSSFGDDDQLFPVLEAGASGFVLKDISPDDLAAAIADVSAGKTRLHPDLAGRLVERVRHPDAADASAPAMRDRLTDRELEVLRRICHGRSNKEIGDDLSISPMTVKTHISNILGKLDVQDRTQAALFAVKTGLVDLDSSS